MRNKSKSFSCMLLIIAFSFSYGNPTFGQEKVNISAGIGLPELLNIGIRYQLGQAQIGLSVGSIPLENESIISILGDLHFHFGGFSRLSDRRPWYGRLGLDYLRDETEDLIDKFLFLNIRIGRDLNISRKFGISIDAGAMILLYDEQVIKNPSNGGFRFDFDNPAFPGAGIALFYRI